MRTRPYAQPPLAGHLSSRGLLVASVSLPNVVFLLYMSSGRKDSGRASVANILISLY